MENMLLFRIKIDNKKDILNHMIRIYCKKHHNTDETLCNDCSDLLEYSENVLNQCEIDDELDSEKFKYYYDDIEKMEKLKEIMKYSGFRIMLYHPIISIRHIFSNKFSIRSLIMSLLGIFFMILGLVGVIIPVLPTTPFLLLASWFFMKSSDKIDKWFRSSNLYKKYLKDFEEDRSMTLKTKVKILSFSTTMLVLAFINIYKLPIRIFIILVMIYKYYYFIFKIKTIKEK